MPTYDPRVDTYIADSAAFAKPMLEQLREWIHDACPEVQETIKWGMPFFEYKGLLCQFAAFRQHCSFGFWKHALLAEKHEILRNQSMQAMGSFGRICSPADLPSHKIVRMLIRDAMKLNEDGIVLPHAGRKTRSTKAPIPEPPYLTKLLAENPKAQKAWQDFSPSCRREYLEWLTEAKTEVTRQRRLDQAITWISEGKHRNWKHQR